MDEYYTVDEVATLLKVTRATVYNWMRDSKLTIILAGGRRRVPRAALEAFLKQPEPVDRAA